MTPAVVAAWLAIVEGAVGLWERITGRYPTPKAPPAAPGQPAAPRRRRVWGGGPPAAALALLSLLAGCAGPFAGMSRDELVQLCEAVAPCEAEEPDCSACVECPPAGGEVVTPGPGGDGAPPTDGGGPAPPAPPAPGGERDAIDLAGVEWGDPSPAGFPVTAALDLPAVDGLRVALSYRLPGTWAVEAAKVNGNAWVCGQVRGGWKCGTFEWLPVARPTGFVSKLEAKPGEPPFIQANGAVAKWRPASGDRVCWLVSSMVRGGRVRQPVGRSPVVCGVWP